jgi:hypothetical protein
MCCINCKAFTAPNSVAAEHHPDGREHRLAREVKVG